jgi:hypothetical protein
MEREKLHIVSQTSPLCDYYRRYVCDSAYLIAASFFARGRAYATVATLALRGLHSCKIPAKKIQSSGMFTDNFCGFWRTSFYFKPLI